MADAEANKKTLQKLDKSSIISPSVRKKQKGEYDVKLGKSIIDIGTAVDRWNVAKDWHELKSDEECAFMLLNSLNSSTENYTSIRQARKKSNTVIDIGNTLQQWNQLKEAVSMDRDQNMALFLIELYLKSEKNLIDSILSKLRQGANMNSSAFPHVERPSHIPCQEIGQLDNMEECSEGRLCSRSSTKSHTDFEGCGEYVIIKEEHDESTIEFIDNPFAESDDCTLRGKLTHNSVKSSSERINSMSTSGKGISTSGIARNTADFVKNVVIKQENEEPFVEDMAIEDKHVIESKESTQDRLGSEITSSGKITNSDGVVVCNFMTLEHHDPSVTNEDSTGSTVSKDNCSNIQESSDSEIFNDTVSLKRKRHDLTLSKKFKVIKLLEEGKTQSAIARCLGVSQSQISRLSKLKEEIKTEFENTSNRDRRRKRYGKAPDIERALAEWARDACSKDIPINMTILAKKSESLAKVLNKNDFKVTSGWITRWKKRQEITFPDPKRRARKQ